MANARHEGTIGAPIGSEDKRVAHYWVETAKEPDKTYGIDGGRILRMRIKIDGETVLNYDKGWDIEPDEEDKLIQIAYSICMKDYN